MPTDEQQSPPLVATMPMGDYYKLLAAIHEASEKGEQDDALIAAFVDVLGGTMPTDLDDL